MVVETVKVVNEQGLHMRPAGVLSKAAAKYGCDVTLKVGDKEINAKSIMMIIGGCIKCGADVEIICNGEQEEDALSEIKALFASGFGE